MTTVTVTEEVIELTEEIVETITVTVAEQGPPGTPGVLAAEGIDIIAGGSPDTDFSAGYIFEGGAP
jgi:hypothetical protein